jgi:6-phosphogluconolactonase
VKYAGENEEMVIAATSHYHNRPAARVTFTPRLINAARHVCFIVSGKGKAEAAAKTICGEFDPLNYPAQRINPVDGRVVWMIDREAASLLKALKNCL